jgi:cell division septum initiation protein DivIVA
VEGLKRTRTGKYRAADVDRLLLKIRFDYEDCMREQKQRILELRNENKELTAIVERHRTDAQYVSDIIAKAQQTAEAIVRQAEMKAMRCLAEAEASSHRMQMEARECVRRLVKLKDASESVYMAACRAVSQDGENEPARAVAQAVLSLYEQEQWQGKAPDAH